MINLGYLETAIRHENIFRNILGDLKQNRNERNLGEHIPQDLKTDSNIEKIFHRYTLGDRTNKFTIEDFQVLDQSARITYSFLESMKIHEKEDNLYNATTLEYSLFPSESVEFKRVLSNTTT
ncbi:MAG: hypothetical protein WC438_00745 [Candidatus Pacearchaeota archaeon]